MSGIVKYPRQYLKSSKKNPFREKKKGKVDKGEMFHFPSITLCQLSG